MKKIKADFPKSYDFLFEPARYKVAYGGRGKGASWSIARYLLITMLEKSLRVLCTREFQNSIADSVHRLLADQISLMGLEPYFNITRTEITCVNGGKFLFEGVRHNPTKIKSMEGIDVCWIAEGEKISNESLDILIPTIRKEGSEILIDFNPDKEDDPIYQRFVLQQPDDTIVRHLTYRDNPFFPETLKKEMEYDRRIDPDKFSWIWEGNTRSFSDALVFHNSYIIDSFEAEELKPERFYFGADFGFSIDPTTLIRSFIHDNKLYIDYEAYGVGVDIDKLPELFDEVPESRRWPITGDSQRPDTISYLKKQGFNIHSSKKGKGSIEDGISYLRSFESIVIHPRCRHTIDEFGSYSYKRDRQTGEILPTIIDKNNHIIDALRYALEKRRKSSSTKISAGSLGL